MQELPVGELAAEEARTKPSEVPPKSALNELWLWFILPLVAIYLYLNLFVSAAVPILLSGDQVFFWMNGQRMLFGEYPYRDFFQFTPPGTDFFYFSLFKLFGPKIWALNASVLIVGVALSLVCFLIAKQIMSRKMSVLMTFLFVVLLYGKTLNATHHWFSVLAIMGALAILVPRMTLSRMMVAGVLLGASSFFTQTHAVFALIALMLALAWQSPALKGRLWKYQVSLLMPFLLTVLALNLPVVSVVGVKQLWFCQFTYVREFMVHGAETAILGMPVVANWRELSPLAIAARYAEFIFVYLLLPIVYSLVLIRCRRDSRLRSDSRIIMLLLTGILLLLEVAFSLNWLRLYAVAMPAIILFGWLVDIQKLNRYFALLLWVLVMGLALSQVLRHRHNYVVADLPAGRAAVPLKDFQKLSWMQQRLTPGEFLFQADWPGMYIPLGVHNPTFLDTADTTQVGEWTQRAIEQLEAKQVHYVVWSSRLDSPPDPHQPPLEYLSLLRSYILQKFSIVQTFADGEQVWERK